MNNDEYIEFREKVRKAYLYSTACLGDDGLPSGVVEKLTGISVYLQARMFEQYRPELEDYFKDRPHRIQEARRVALALRATVLASRALQVEFGDREMPKETLALFCEFLKVSLKARQKGDVQRASLKFLTAALVEEGALP